ncbi:MAG: AIR synthase family protein [Nitriliruptorales bacterium]|nr:AIR synthase family protein [Nitriliruptorales bacterium]
MEDGAVTNPPGKITADVYRQVILQHLGAADDAVVVPSQHGVDIGVVRIGDGNVMALSADPVFIVPAYGWERAAWFAVHILASDAALSGLPLRWMTVDLNLPMELSDDDLAAMWTAFSETCEQLAIAIVTGHTGRYEGCNWPMVGGATCFAVGPEDRYVTPKGARAGDRVIVTKGAAIEATALFGATFTPRLAEELGSDVADDADALFDSMTVVPECRVAANYGLRDDGVTAMHDATEGGVLGGLVEIADAAGLGIRVDKDAIPVRPEVRTVCDHVGIDPYVSISEGTLLATVRPDHAAGFLAALDDAGIEAADVGEMRPEREAKVLVVDGAETPLEHPDVDPFWEAFGRWAIEAERATDSG